MTLSFSSRGTPVLVQPKFGPAKNQRAVLVTITARAASRKLVRIRIEGKRSNGQGNGTCLAPWRRHASGSGDFQSAVQRAKRPTELESSVNPQARKPALLAADTLNGFR